MRIFNLMLVIKIFERFNFYAYNGVFLFFLIDYLQYSQSDAKAIFSIMFYFMYFLPFINSYIYDNWLNYKECLIFSAIFNFLGAFLNCLSFYYVDLFYWGSAFICLGVSLFSVNFNNLLGVYYDKYNEISLKGYKTMHIMGNLGSLFAFLTMGYMRRFSFFSIFILICALNFLLLIFLLKNYKNLSEDKAINLGIFKKLLILTMFFVLVFLIKMVYFDVGIFFHYMKYLHLLFIAILSYVLIKERDKKLLLILFIIFSGMIFYSIMLQMQGFWLLFIDKYLYKQIFTYNISSVAYQSLNPLIILIYHFYGKKHDKIKSFILFILGLFSISIFFALFYIGARNAVDFKIHYIYFILSILILTIAEYCINPFLTSSVQALSPKHLKGFGMSVMMYGISLSSLIMPYIELYFPTLKTLQHYENIFFYGMIWNFFFVLALLPIFYLTRRFFIE